MRYTHYLYIVPFALLAACSSEDPTSFTDNSGKEPIVLSAGIVEGAQQEVTRAGTTPESGEKNVNHTSHLTLTNNTKLVLRVSGTWKHGSSTIDVIKNTTATVGSTTGTDKLHNELSCSPTLYWDDYGTADPDNTTGRSGGLTIYGVAIDGKTSVPSELTSISSATALSSWQGLTWTLPTDQSASGNTPADKDLLISNNVSSNTETSYSTYPLDCGTYKFDQTNRAKLLEFHHAMSKITVNLKAGNGFTDNKFAATPTVTLTSNLANQTSEAEWAYTTGTVNVTDGTVSSQAGNAAITMAAGTPTTTLSTAGYTVTKEALVMPGSVFKKDATIIRINADGNIYYVDANKIRTAINSTAHDETVDLTQAGKNYIFNIIVNKTDIVVTATVTDWTTVTAAVDEPVINVNADWGTTGSLTSNAFSFYRSTSLNNGYSNDASLIENSFYKPEATVSYASSAWSMSPTLYWPNHNTHYQFRGVYPQTVTTTGNDVGYPRVETATHSSVDYQVIKVRNVAYSANTFPSDLQIARPEIDASTLCSNNDHTQVSLYNVGICATEGTINLNFRYMMSQVEVNLTTSGSTATDRVDLSSAQVDLVNVYNTGDVKLGDREVILTGSPGEYTLGNFTYDSSNSKASYKSAIVPQALTYTTAQADGNVKFRVTIKEGGVVKDIYYADVAPIKEWDTATSTAKTTLVAPGPNDTNKTDATQAIWQSGYHYVYNLYLTKTKVDVTATLASWTKVEAQQNVWF